KKMNRRHTVAEFIKLVEEIRKAVPEIELGTDAIVGFPGETRAQFMATVKLFERLKFKVAFISMYSPRAGTWAQKQFSDDVDQMEKKWRHAHLTKVWRESLKAHE
ncbi:MAG: tRNA (N6-isopentenyl adenosine(37)-C2)-methylthiotransferase MiaB, partial [bacterium]